MKLRNQLPVFLTDEVSFGSLARFIHNLSSPIVGALEATDLKVSLVSHLEEFDSIDLISHIELAVHHEINHVDLMQLIVYHVSLI